MSRLRKAAARALPDKYKRKLRSAVHPAQRQALARLVRKGEPDVGLLSVIVPVYNVAEYIADCLTSIVSQSYYNLEIIVVDDGSTDSSMDIVADFAKHDKRIKTIQLENGGNGRARNIGIAAASGEYLAFADSDDVVAPGAYSLMMASISNSGSDFVVGSYVRLVGRKLQNTKISAHMHATKRIGIAIDDFPDILDDVFFWNKVFRRAFWDSQVSPIPEGVLYEDQESTARAYVRAVRFDVLEEVVYFWRQREDGTSITQGKRRQKDLDDRIAVAEHVTALLVSESAPQVIEKWFVRLFGSDLVPYYSQVPYTDDAYWDVLSTGIVTLSELMVENVSAVDRPFALMDPHARVMMRLAVSGMKDELEQVVVDRMEVGTGYELEVVDGRFYAKPNYWLTLPDYSRTDRLVCDPSLVEFDSSVVVRGWTDDGGLMISGHGFLRGLNDELLESAPKAVLISATRELLSLRTRAWTDENLDARVNDVFASHKNSVFDAVIPAPLIREASSDQLNIDVSVSAGNNVFDKQYTISIPDKTRINDIVSPQVCGFSVDNVTEDLLIDVKWNKTAIPQHVFLATQQHRLMPSAMVDFGGTTRRYRFPLTREHWGHTVHAPPSGSYSLRYKQESSAPTRAQGQTVEADQSMRWQAPIDYKLQHAHIQAWLTDAGRFAVTISGPLTSSERGKYWQRQLQQIYENGSAAQGQHVVFESFGGKICTDSPLALSDELSRRHPDVEIYWSIVDHSVHYPKYSTPLIRGSKRWYEIVSSAKYVVNNQNFPYYYRKPINQRYLQTWHGTPLKRIGIDAPIHTISPSYRKSIERESASWDALLAQNDFAAKALASSLGHAGTVLKVGYPRNDALVNSSKNEIRQKTRESFGAGIDSLVVLYAPTWRDTHKVNESTWKEIEALDLELLVAGLPADSKILLRSHHNVKVSHETAANGHVIHVSDHPDINALILASDALVTDYSSILFDYSVTNKPIIFFAPDLMEYEDEIRGFNLNYESLAKETLCLTTQEVMNVLSLILSTDMSMAKMDKIYRQSKYIHNTYADQDDGQASGRVIQWMLDTGLLANLGDDVQ